MSLFLYGELFPVLESDFAINPNSGILTSNKVFDYEEQYMYNVTLTATDIRQHSVSITY